MKNLLSPRTLFRISVIYFALPAIIFSISWLATPLAIIMIMIISWSVYQIWRSKSLSYVCVSTLSRRSIFWMGLTLLIWIVLSGIGGLAFQNWDFHWRNAVLRDLITYSWPVIYHPISLAEPKLLVYYIAYWLPSALVGKIFGWGAANVFLMLWTFIGCLLVALGLCIFLRSQTIFPVFLLIFFSGLDAVGLIIRSHIDPIPYPSLWPPVQHLEVWSNPIQYSSTTTQLFWIFNQSVPVWLFMVLLLNGIEKRFMIFLWSLCFFITPFSALGALPYVAIEVFHNGNESGIRNNIKQFISVENIITGIALIVISLAYFSANKTQSNGTTISPGIMVILITLIFEWLLLWVFLLPSNFREIRWYVVGALLLLCAFLRAGNLDFGSRLSIPSLFLLMTAVGKVIVDKRGAFVNLIAVYFIFGSLTPLYEINRSIERTAQYYFLYLKITIEQTSIESELKTFPHPENAHPQAFLADGLKTLGGQESYITSYWGDLDSAFYRFLARH